MTERSTELENELEQKKKMVIENNKVLRAITIFLELIICELINEYRLIVQIYYERFFYIL